MPPSGSTGEVSGGEDEVKSIRHGCLNSGSPVTLENYVVEYTFSYRLTPNTLAQEEELQRKSPSSNEERNVR